MASTAWNPQLPAGANPKGTHTCLGFNGDLFLPNDSIYPQNEGELEPSIPNQSGALRRRDAKSARLEDESGLAPFLWGVRGNSHRIEADLAAAEGAVGRRREEQEAGAIRGTCPSLPAR